MAAGLASRFNTLIFSLLIFIVHAGCFLFASPHGSSKKTGHCLPSYSRKRKPINSNNLSPKKALSASWSFIKRAFTDPSLIITAATTRRRRRPTAANTASFPSSPRSSSLMLPVSDPDPDPNPCPPRRRRASGPLSENPFLPLRNDAIFPCPSCGEVFQKAGLLEQHQSAKHAVSELRDSDSGKNIVWIIFNTGWTRRERGGAPRVERILKIHNSQRVVSRFEEYREAVRSRAERSFRRDERCAADGNELLRFHCTTFVCGLGQNGNSSLCGQQYCSACGIIRAGFSPKLDGIPTLSTSWGAHASVPADLEEEFAFMNVRRAMLVCRVVAGRVGLDPVAAGPGKDDPGFDSLLVGGRGGPDDHELLVFNPRAVLPCFVIVYSV